MVRVRIDPQVALSVVISLFSPFLAVHLGETWIGCILSDRDLGQEASSLASFENKVKWAEWFSLELDLWA